MICAYCEEKIHSQRFWDDYLRATVCKECKEELERRLKGERGYGNDKYESHKRTRQSDKGINPRHSDRERESILSEDG